MLASQISQGTTLTGLRKLFLRGAGGVVGDDTGEKNLGIQASFEVNGTTINFHVDQFESSDRAKASPKPNQLNRVNLLPYLQGGIAYATMQGRPTISGQFTGCIMGIYNKGGITRVCHVDTAKDSLDLFPSKNRWEAMKKEDGFELADEFSTNKLIKNFLDEAGKDPSTRDNMTQFANMCILSVASPVTGITSYYANGVGDDYVIIRRIDRNTGG